MSKQLLADTRKFCTCATKQTGMWKDNEVLIVTKNTGEKHGKHSRKADRVKKSRLDENDWAVLLPRRNITRDNKESLQE